MSQRSVSKRIYIRFNHIIIGGEYNHATQKQMDYTFVMYFLWSLWCTQVL